jgi:hypothetical protein
MMAGWSMRFRDILPTTLVVTATVMALNTIPKITEFMLKGAPMADLFDRLLALLVKSSTGFFVQFLLKMW